jgi:hypothetical protein
MAHVRQTLRRAQSERTPPGSAFEPRQRGIVRHTSCRSNTSHGTVSSHPQSQLQPQSSIMPADNAKRIRRRSKSGCLTCRVRKIKVSHLPAAPATCARPPAKCRFPPTHSAQCDEAHPVCSRGLPVMAWIALSEADARALSLPTGCEKIGRACAYPAPKEQRPRPSGRQKLDASRMSSVSAPGHGEAAAHGAERSPAIGSVEVVNLYLGRLRCELSSR